MGDLTVAAYEPYLSPTGTYRAKLRDLEARTAVATVLVAVDGDRVLGTVSYAPEPGFQEIAPPGEAEFRMRAFDPAAQGMGVGDAIVADLIERTRRLGLQRLVCSTQRGMHAAHRLYERHGFAREPDRDWSPAANIVLLVYGREV